MASSPILLAYANRTTLRVGGEEYTVARIEGSCALIAPLVDNFAAMYVALNAAEDQRVEMDMVPATADGRSGEGVRFTGTLSGVAVPRIDADDAGVLWIRAHLLIEDASAIPTTDREAVAV